jgi:transposase InsO family protein
VIVSNEAARRAGGAPKYTVSDQGSEFGEEYREWCEDHEVRARFGAVGRHGSIAVEERFYAKLAIMRSSSRPLQQLSESTSSYCA